MQCHQATAALHIDIHFECKIKLMTLMYLKARWKEMDKDKTPSNNVIAHFKKKFVICCKFGQHFPPSNLSQPEMMRPKV